MKGVAQNKKFSHVGLTLFVSKTSDFDARTACQINNLKLYLINYY